MKVKAGIAMSDAKTSMNINFKSLIVFKMIFDIHVSYLYQHTNILKSYVIVQK